jgi:hypothetical protein
VIISTESPVFYHDDIPVKSEACKKKTGWHTIRDGDDGDDDSEAGSSIDRTQEMTSPTLWALELL